MAADVRRWRGYCRRTASSAALPLGASGAMLSTSACWPLCTLRERPLSGRLDNCVNFT